MSEVKKAEKRSHPGEITLVHQHIKGFEFRVQCDYMGHHKKHDNM